MSTALRVVLLSSVLGLGPAGLASAAVDANAAAELNKAEPVVDPSDLVGAMSAAMKTLNYEGNFVHIQGNNITTMNILHSSDDKGELERLSALDGEAREVYRNYTLVTCIWPDSESVVISKTKPRHLLPNVGAELAVNKRYRFTMGKPDRVAGLPTYVVNVEPSDSFRYGYRFWIDKQTKMLLRSMLLDGQQSIEQVMFTFIKYPIIINAARFEVERSKALVSWLEPEKLQATSGLGLPETQDDQVDRISFDNLPDGYREVSETYSSMPINDGPVSHVMLSDGMASVSVYVEYLPLAEQSQGAQGLSNMGAMNAFGLSSDNAFITAVGDVPAVTVKAIASAVQIR